MERGDNVAAGQLLFQIDNPELVTKLQEAQAGLAVAAAQLANIEAGTRAEVIAQRKAAVDSAAANLTLAQRTYDRVKELAGSRQRADPAPRRGDEFAASRAAQPGPGEVGL